MWGLLPCGEVELNAAMHKILYKIWTTIIHIIQMQMAEKPIFSMKCMRRIWYSQKNKLPYALAQLRFYSRLSF